MAIFGKIFGSKKPAPSYEIHSNDMDLIKSEDTDWWDILTMDELKEIEKQDNLTRFTVYIHFTETKGMSKDELLNEIKISFPIYYLTLNQRLDKPFFGRMWCKTTMHTKKSYKQFYDAYDF